MVTLNTEAAPVAPSRGADERGFGVVEIVVSMFLLLIIAAAFLPLMIQGYQLSVVNATVATATQLGNQQVERVRGVSATAAGTVGPTCTAVVTALNSPAPGTPAQIAAGVLNADYKPNRNSVLSASATLVWGAAPGGPATISTPADCTLGAANGLLTLTTVVTDSAEPSKPLAEIVTQLFVSGS